jgi:putative phosphoribosyl transferase
MQQGKSMIFKNRQQAGRRLVQRLEHFSDSEEALIVAIPRGGISIALEVATALHLSMDIRLSGRLRVPGHEELAFGAMAGRDSPFVDQTLVEQLGISHSEILDAIRKTRKRLEKRADAYRAVLPALDVAGKTIIVVDDGISTGATMCTIVEALRQTKPRKLVVAVPVAPFSAVACLRSLADELVILHIPIQSVKVADFYEEFPVISERDVIARLELARAVNTRNQLSRQRSCGCIEPLTESGLYTSITDSSLN